MMALTINNVTGPKASTESYQSYCHFKTRSQRGSLTRRLGPSGPGFSQVGVKC